MVSRQDGKQIVLQNEWEMVDVEGDRSPQRVMQDEGVSSSFYHGTVTLLRRGSKGSKRQRERLVQGPGGERRGSEGLALQGRGDTSGKACGSLLEGAGLGRECSGYRAGEDGEVCHQVASVIYFLFFFFQ